MWFYKHVCKTTQKDYICEINVRMITPEQQIFYSTIGRKISDARKKAKYKQEVFASLLNLSRSSIVNIEKGRQHPSIHLLWEIAIKLKVNFIDLMPQSLPTNDVDAELIKEIQRLPKSEEQTKKSITGFLQEIQSSKIKPL